MNICNLIEETKKLCKSKKIVTPKIKEELVKIGFRITSLGTSKKYCLGNRCNLIHIDKRQTYNIPGYYLIVGTAALGTKKGNIYRGFIKQLTNEEVVTLKLFNYKFYNEN